MGNENLVRQHFLIDAETLKEIDRYRQDVGTLPPKSQAIRELIKLGLETYWEKKGQGRE